MIHVAAAALYQLVYIDDQLTLSSTQRLAARLDYCNALTDEILIELHFRLTTRSC